MIFLKAITITISLELLAAFVFITCTKMSKRILVYVIIANIISVPIVWYIFPLLKNAVLVTVSSELFAWIFEATFIFITNRQFISFKNALMLSLIMNFVSYSVGEIIYFYFPWVLLS
jgi:hypothetical protein